MEEPKLEKTLSYPVILIITINSILGTGIFFLPAVGARMSGPASLIAWAILSVVAIYISMFFAELTSMFPKAGGVYEFCKQAFGRFWSFIIGWMTIIAGNITIAMLVVGAIQYLLPLTGEVTYLGITLHSSIFKIIICITFVLFFNYIAYRGMKTSAAMLVGFGVVTLGTLTALIIPGLMHFNAGNFTPFLVTPKIAIIVTIFLIAETFFGWETATFLAAETKKGEKVVPKALIISTIIIALISLLFVATSLSTINWRIFGLSITPLTDLAVIHYGSLGGTIFTWLVYVSIIGSVAGWIVSAPRLLLAMTEDKLILTQFKKIHPKRKTPYNAILFQTGLTIILIIMGFGSYKILLELLIPLVLVMYSAVIFSLVVLRKKMPYRERHFRVPFAKIGAFFIIMFLLSLIGMWLKETSTAIGSLTLAVSLIGVGFPVYFLIEMYYDPKAIIKINDSFAYLALLTERISLPMKVRRKIFLLLNDLERKTVLEYGCSVGTLTLLLARKVGPFGKVYATDISIKHLNITQKRIEKHKKKYSSSFSGKVETLHDEKQMIRIHPSIPYADVVVSVGMLGYIQDVKKVLSDIYEILPEGGEICFVEFGDFFKVIPNVEWLTHNSVIEKVFRDAGFSVRVIREKGTFWNYIYVYGIKSEHDVPFI